MHHFRLNKLFIFEKFYAQINLKKKNLTNNVIGQAGTLFPKNYFIRNSTTELQIIDTPGIGTPKFEFFFF